MSLSNQQYNIILRKYDAIRQQKAHELDARKQEIADKLPEYTELENESISLSMKYAKEYIKAGISNNDSFLDEYHKSILDIRIRKNRLLEANGYPKDYLEMQYECPKCMDTGYIGEQKCSCFVKKQVELVYDYSQMKDLLENSNFENLSYEYYNDEGLEKFEKAVTTCKHFIKNFYSDYHNLLFYGTVGTGKSFLSGCVAKELLDKGCSIIYTSAINLFQEISNHIYSHDKEIYINLYESLLGCDLLIIDDLGTENTNDFTRTHLFNIINERMLKRKSIIISTNMTLDEFRSTYTERVFSRVCENYELLHLTGIKDIRIQKKLEQREENNHGE